MLFRFSYYGKETEYESPNILEAMIEFAKDHEKATLDLDNFGGSHFSDIGYLEVEEIH